MHLLTKRPKFSTFDTETTGLPAHPLAALNLQPRVIEFGGIITDGVEVLDKLEFICNPQVEIEPIITKITGLTNNDLVDKPPFKTFIPQIEVFFKQADYAVAHNLSFDEGMMRYDLERLGLELDAISFPAGKLCTVEQLFHRFGKRIRLQDWYALRCGDYVQKHRALDDVMLLHKLCQVEGIYDAITG